jgi:PAS domain S-box-containing protein
MKAYHLPVYFLTYAFFVLCYWVLINLVWVHSDHYSHLIFEIIGYILLISGGAYLLHQARFSVDKINHFKQYKNFLDLSLDGFYAMNPDTLEFFYVSKGAYQQLGYDYESGELLGKTPQDIDCNPNLENMHAQLVAPLLNNTANISRAESIHRRKDGSQFPVQVILQLTELEGYGKCFIAAIRDISEQKAREALQKSYQQQLQDEIELKTQALIAEIARRTEIEEALKSNQERFALALRASNDGLWDLDLRTQEFFYSARWKEMLGYAEHELENTLTVWESLVHPDDLPIINQQVHDYLDGKIDKYENMHRLLHKDGHYIWVLDRGMGLKDETGKYVRFTGTHTDLTLQKQTEEALKASQERFALALRAGNDGLWDWNLETNEIFFSPRWKEMIGFADHELPNIFETWQKLVHPDDIQPAMAKIQAYLAGESDNYELIHRLQHKDGHYIWILDRGMGLKDETGKYVRFIGTHTDLTLQKQTEAALEASQERFALALRASNDGLWDWNLETNEIFFSPRWKEMIGFADHELPNSFDTWQKLVHPDDIQLGMAKIQAYLAGEFDNFELIHRLQHKDGHYVWILGRGIGLKNSAGKYIRFIGTHTDLTTQKQAEEILANYNQQLKQEVADQTKILELKALELDKQRIKFTTILDSLEAVIYIADMHSHELLFVNEHTKLAFGADYDNKLCFQYFHNANQPCAFCTNTKLLDENGLAAGPYRWEIHNKFNNKWYYIIDRAIEWEDGRLVRLEIATDITQIKQAEEKIRINEKRFRSIFEQPVVGIVVSDLDKNILQINDRMCEIWGYTREQLTQFDWTELTYPDDLAADVANFARLIKKEINGYTLDKRFIRQDGKIIYTTIAASAVFDENGEVDYVIAVVQDIDQRKRTEQDLLKSQTRLDEAQRIAHLGNWEWDIQTNIIIWSDEIYRIFGAEPGSFIPDYQRFMHFIHPEDREAVQFAVNSALEKQYYSVEHRILWDDGQIRIVHEQAQAVFDETGKAVRMIGIVQDITERKQAEIELNLAKFALDNSPDSVFWVAADASLIYANLTSCELLNYTNAEILGMKVWDVDPNTPASVWNNIWHDAKVNSKFSIETVNKRKDGYIFPAEVRAVYLNYEGKEFLCAFARDITERKHAEQIILKSQTRLDEAQRIAHLGNWEWNIQTGELIWSKESYRIFGLTPPEELEAHGLNYEDFIAFVHPDDKNRLEQVLKKALDDAQPYEIDYRIVLKNGEVRILNVQSETVIGRFGQPERMIGVMQDITERKLAEQAIKEANSRFDLVNQATNEGLWDMVVFDQLNPVHENSPIWYSSKLRGLLGYNDENDFPSLVSSWMYSLHPEDRDMSVKLFIDHVADITGETTYNIESRMKLKSGKYRWFNAVGTTLRDENGLPLRIAGSIRDITERKQAEDALRMAINSAEKARKQAEIANQAKSTFLANMSHELRTPLNGILGYTQILSRDKEITSKQLEGINIIQRSGEYLLTLINDILDLSKIEADRVELYPVDIHFAEFMQGIVELFQMRAEQKGISFIYEPLNTLPAGVRADEKRLRQVLINLLANAIKFTNLGGVCLRVGYNQGLLRFEIEDTGVGIPEEDLEKIFLPFQQSGDKYSKAEGTGLGLSITKRIIEMMHGQLEVKSTYGRGSVFWFELALPEVSNLLTHKQTHQKVITGFAEASKNILVLDDKMENRLVLKHLLTPLGFNIIEADNGKEGLSQLNQNQIDIILTDLVMPVMDGFEFARRVRGMEKYQSLPMIAVSASVFDYHQQQSVEAGCNEFIPKPVRADVLLASLQRYLHLTWLYDREQQTTTKVENNSKTTAELVVEIQALTDEQIAILYDLAMQGDTMGLIDYTLQLEAEDANLARLMGEIANLAKDFDYDKICDLIQADRSKQ